MKNKIIRYALLIMAGSLLLTACQNGGGGGGGSEENTDKTTFLKKTEIGYYTTNFLEFGVSRTFLKQVDQLIISEDYSEYSIINTLEALSYDSIKFLLKTPLTGEKVGTKINITIILHNKTVSDVDFIIEKIDNKKIWFWNNEKLIGIILEKL